MKICVFRYMRFASKSCGFEGRHVLITVTAFSKREERVRLLMQADPFCSLHRAGNAAKGAILSRERMAPFRSPKRTQGALPLDPNIDSLDLEELLSLRNRVRCTWLRHEPLPPRYYSQPRLTIVRRV